MINSYFENIEIEICNAINLSTKSIDIAVAWLSNYGIINLLKLKARIDNVKVRIIINNDKINSVNDSLFDDLLDENILIYKYNGSNLMHNKFAIIDSRTILTGSYNWTKNAEYNLENIVITTNDELAKKYEIEFNKILENSTFLNDNFSKENSNVNLKVLNEMHLWDMLKHFHKAKYNPSVYRLFKTICGTKSTISKYTKDFPFYNSIHLYKSKQLVLLDIKSFFELNAKKISEEFNYTERGWNNVEFPSEIEYNFLSKTELNAINSNVNNNLYKGKKWTNSELNTLSFYLLKTNNPIYLSKLLNRSEVSVIIKVKRLLYENRLLLNQYESIINKLS